jgi:hypothetical protein
LLRPLQHALTARIFHNAGIQSCSQRYVIFHERKHFREELDTGHIKASAKVAGNLYRIATGSGREAVTAAIFWLV